ncbi:LytTR family transcriptional regulator DNA-binding domain-containing protein [Spirosoma sp. SC4-14]|uniref:LytTR family transcriptional regulator DNA-binding domain-containing protein n=1 Tax=Spirosoma sp. SC4-14 TaxID=3128900 RepID=UPI0030CFF5C6
MAHPQLRDKEPPGYIMLPALGLTAINDIFGFISDTPYVRVQLRGHFEPVLITEPLRYFEKRLPHFRRISRSRLINPDLL